MIVDWIKANKKLASKIMGANFLVMAFILIFWSQPKEGMSENEKAAANVARMEARLSGDSQTKAAAQSSNFMKEYRQSQQAQLRIFLVIMVIAGVGFLLYGFLKKEEPSDES